MKRGTFSGVIVAVILFAGVTVASADNKAEHQVIQDAISAHDTNQTQQHQNLSGQATSHDTAQTSQHNALSQKLNDVQTAIGHLSTGGPAPSTGWLGRWVYSTGAGDTTQINTEVFIYNPGDPSDANAPYAHVKVEFRRDGCTPTRELFADSGSYTAPGDMAILPLVPTPDKTAGIGCTIVTSDVPIFVSARIEHYYSRCATDIGCVSRLSHEDPAFFPVSWGASP